MKTRTPFLVLLLCLTLPTGVWAVNYAVVDTADNGPYLTGQGIGTNGDLRYCIAQANQNPGSSIDMGLLNATITRELPPITTSMTIYTNSAGVAGGRIDAGSSSRIFFIDAPGATVSLIDLQLVNAKATGGAGGTGSGGGGGGLGGAIFVNAGNLAITRVAFINVAATGGRGGDYPSNGRFGGGGGLNGAGGNDLGGGGGYRGAGGNGGSSMQGVFAGGGGGGIVGNGANGSNAGGGGGGGTVAGSGVTGGGGGGDGGVSAYGMGLTGTNGNPGGLNGGGGGAGYGSEPVQGGDGGKFGGGGGSNNSVNSNSCSGGNGGDFGGGGSARANEAGTFKSKGGDGGFGGGGGAGATIFGVGGFGGGNGGRGAPLFKTGNGGTAYGGAVFVRASTGGSLTVIDSSMPAGVLTAGEPGVGGGGGSAGLVGGGSSIFLYGSGNALVFTTGTNQTVSGSIATDPTSNVGLVKYGGSVLTLTAPNSYPGTTDVREGTLRVSGTGTLGSSTANLTVQGGATLDLAGVAATAGFFVIGNGGGIGQVVNSSGAGSTLTVGAGNASGGFQNGPMSGNIGLTKVGNGTHALHVPNSYTGPTIVSSGTLILDTSSGAPLIDPASAITIATGARLLFQGGSFNALALNNPGPLTISGTLETSSGAHTLRNFTLAGGTLSGSNPNAAYGNFVLNSSVVTVSGSATISAPLVQLHDITATPTFNVGSGAQLTISGRLTDTNFNGSTYLSFGGLVKTGPGTVQLTNGNIYTGGTTINGGTLQFSGVGSVYNGGTLAGSSVAVSNGAVLSFGRNDTFGDATTLPLTSVTLNGARIENAGNFFNTLGNLTLNNGSELRANGGANAGYQAFQLRGTVSAGGTTPSSITAPSGTNNAMHLDGRAGATVFSVSDVTNSPASDLTVSAILGNGYNATNNQVACGLTKSGAGTLLLNNANSYTGGTTINGGTLALGSGGNLGTGAISIAGGATLDLTAVGSSGFTLASGQTLTNNGSTLGVLNVSGTLLGDGSLGGLRVNSGALVARSSGTLTVTGEITNKGTLRFTGGAIFNSGGAASFVNNGLIDLITAGPTSSLPPGFTNGSGGVVLQPGDVLVKSSTLAAGAFTVKIDGHTGHTYQLQRSPDLNTPFVNLGSPQTGTTQPDFSGTELTFSDMGATGANGFYRVVVTP